MQPHILLLTGRPGIGKTTVIRRAAKLLDGLRIRGFYTGEIREAGQRVGFDLTTFDRHRQVMAHVRFAKRHRVGRYGVDVVVLDEIANRLEAARGVADLYLMDEIGKMECLSPRFVSALRELLGRDRPVVATIAQHGTGFIQEVKGRRDVQMCEVTCDNRDAMPDRVAGWVRRVAPSTGMVRGEW
jgi:nucleoside-triphosphatase